MALLKPLRDVFGFQLQIMLARAYLYLNFFNLGIMDFSFTGLLFFVLGVLEFTIIHDFCNRGNGIRRNLNKVQTGLLGLFQSLFKRTYTDIFTLGPDRSEFFGVNLVVYSGF